MEGLQHPLRVPSHLEQYHPSPEFTQCRVSPSPSLPRSSSSPEFFPAHRQAHEKLRKPSLRATLKTIICKDWARGLSETPGQHILDDLRPAMKRMKDSDDYITARAANPRTGLISPSVGNMTPDSPADALRLRDIERDSPTPARPMLVRANEGRKISGGDEPRQAHAADQRRSTCVRRPASPQTVQGEYHSDRASITSSALSKDDQLVVHMPSAREPQPFTYPGYSPEQIEAFEHYKDKSRRISGDGYDRRLVGAAPHPFVPTNVEFKEPPAEQSYVCPFTGLHFRPYRGVELDGLAKVRSLKVRKRNARVNDRKHQDNDMANKVGCHTFSPLQVKADQIPSHKGMECKENQRSHPVTHRKDSKQAEMCSATIKTRADPVTLAPSNVTVANATECTAAGADQHQDQPNLSSPHVLAKPRGPRPLTREAPPDLSKLPKVRLVRPEHAAGLPRQREPQEEIGGQRQCSFGCQSSNGQCTSQRNTSDASTVLRRVSPFETSVSPSPQPTNVEVLISLILMVSDYIRCIQLPKISLFETLASSEVSAHEKIEALKTLLTLTGHVLATCTALAMMWKLVAAIMQVLGVLLWPLAVPLRVLRWIAAGS